MSGSLSLPQFISLFGLTEGRNSKYIWYISQKEKESQREEVLMKI